MYMIREELDRLVQSLLNLPGIESVERYDMEDIPSWRLSPRLLQTGFPIIHEPFFFIYLVALPETEPEKDCLWDKIGWGSPPTIISIFFCSIPGHGAEFSLTAAVIQLCRDVPPTFGITLKGVAIPDIHGQNHRIPWIPVVFNLPVFPVYVAPDDPAEHLQILSSMTGIVLLPLSVSFFLYGTTYNTLSQVQIGISFDVALAGGLIHTGKTETCQIHFMTELPR